MNADGTGSIMDKAFAKLAKTNKKFGFVECPKCKTKHAEKTLNCKGCGYQITVPDVSATRKEII